MWVGVGPNLVFQRAARSSSGSGERTATLRAPSSRKRGRAVYICVQTRSDGTRSTPMAPPRSAGRIHEAGSGRAPHRRRRDPPVRNGSGSHISRRRSACGEVDDDRPAAPRSIHHVAHRDASRRPRFRWSRSNSEMPARSDSNTMTVTRPPPRRRAELEVPRTRPLLSNARSEQSPASPAMTPGV